MDLILASGSPRRQELLRQIGLTDFTVHPADVDERIAPGMTPAQAVVALATQKAQAVAADFPDDLVLAADTVVALDGAILGKPKSEAHAAEMLQRLSGRSHRVYTGFALAQGGRMETGYEETAVHFRPLAPEEIAAYVATGEPMDKAGGYGIQGLGAVFITGIDGDYFNVMGLPVCRVAQALSGFGLTPWKG